MKLKIGDRCPACKRRAGLQRCRAHSFWETKIFPWIGLKPFRCSACGCRIIAFKERADSRRQHLRSGDPSQGRSSEDEQRFQELILAIEHSEKSMHLEETVKPSQTWPPARRVPSAPPASVRGTVPSMESEEAVSLEELLKPAEMEGAISSR